MDARTTDLMFEIEPITIILTRNLNKPSELQGSIFVKGQQKVVAVFSEGEKIDDFVKEYTVKSLLDQYFREREIMENITILDSERIIKERPLELGVLQTYETYAMESIIMILYRIMEGPEVFGKILINGKWETSNVYLNGNKKDVMEKHGINLITEAKKTLTNELIGLYFKKMKNN